MAKSPEQEHPHKAIGWAARDKSGLFSPFHFSRRENGDEDDNVKILYCGVCRSDDYIAKNEWGIHKIPRCSWVPLSGSVHGVILYRFKKCIKNQLVTSKRHFVFQSHEIVGTVMKVGSSVKKFKVGERVGVGVIVGSCKKCES